MSIAIFLFLLSSSSNELIHPRYNLGSLPKDGGYAINIAYNARLKFIVPLKCKHESEVSHPSETTQPGLEIVTNHVQHGSTAVTLYIPPSARPPLPGTLFQASMLCERRVDGSDDGVLFVLPMDVRVVEKAENGTRTVVFSLDGKTARGLAETEIGILRSAEEKCLQKIEELKPTEASGVASALLMGYAEGSSYGRFSTDNHDVVILPDRRIRIGDTLYMAFRLNNHSRNSIEITRVDVEMANGTTWSLDPKATEISGSQIVGLGTQKNKHQTMALQLEGSSAKGRTQHGILAISDLGPKSSGKINVTWTLSDGRKFDGTLWDLEGQLW